MIFFLCSSLIFFALCSSMSYMQCCDQKIFKIRTSPSKFQILAPKTRIFFILLKNHIILHFALKNQRCRRNFFGILKNKGRKVENQRCRRNFFFAFCSSLSFCFKNFWKNKGRLFSFFFTQPKYKNQNKSEKSGRVATLHICHICLKEKKIKHH